MPQLLLKMNESTKLRFLASLSLAIEMLACISLILMRVIQTLKRCM
jgi:hypothetical protein